MFDLMEWEWSYECDPIGGWLPDFVVKTKYPADRMYVEVKPFLDLNDEAAKEGELQISRRPSVHQGDPEALLLGRAPFHHQETDLVRIGWLYRWAKYHDGTGMWRGMAFPTLTSQNGFPTGLISEHGDEGNPNTGFTDRITGKWRKRGDVPFVPGEFFMGMWGKAKNTVRYRPRST
jgi:hypothetical protein